MHSDTGAPACRDTALAAQWAVILWAAISVLPGRFPAGILAAFRWAYGAVYGSTPAALFQKSAGRAGQCGYFAGRLYGEIGRAHV